MPGCSVVGCKTRRKKGLTIRLHRFPANPIRRKHWQENVGRKGWIPKKNSLICQAHFDDDQFEKNRTDGKRNLKFNAVPTIFPHGRHLRKPLKRTYIAHNSGLKLKIPERVTADHNYCAKDMPSERPGRARPPRSPLKLEFDKSSYPWLRKSTTKTKNSKRSSYKSSNQTNTQNLAHMDSQNLRNIDAQHSVHTDQQHSVHTGTQNLAHIDNEDHTYSDTQNCIHTENQNSENLIETDNKCGKEEHSFSRPNSESNSEMIEELKTSLRKSERKCEKLIKEREILTAAFKKFFAEDQLKALATGGLHGIEWTSETIKKTMELKSICGRKGYRYLLAKNYLFPSERTLQRRIRQKKEKEEKAMDEKAKIGERYEPGTQNVDGAHVSSPSSDMVVLRLLDSENGTVQDLACNDENVLALFGITRTIGDGQIVPESATNGRDETTEHILPDELIKICQSEEFLQTNSEGMTFEIGDISTNNDNVVLGTRQCLQQQANNGTSISGIQQQNSASCSDVLPVVLQQPTLGHSTDSPVTNMVSSSNSLSTTIDTETEVVVTADFLEPNGPLVEVLAIPYMMESSIVDGASHEAVYASIQDQCSNMLLQQHPKHS
ncbi:uncharacterized protein [Antedon mediterranea]|uniref:uncharacterized protein isoform X2 n=1 Tax=Antedon mediterranea TaxID=105859 RepID=UPI003AF5BF2E